MPLYLKGALLLSAAVAGLTLLPGSLLNALLSPIVGKLFDQYGAKKFLPIGFLFTLISSVIFVLTISAETPVWQIIVGYMVLFAGISMIIMPAQTNGLNQFPDSSSAELLAAGVKYTFFFVTGLSCVGLLVSLFIKPKRI
ncbi:MFS-type transporter involved in bile tolerance (Atg22 family) [Paenibacillus sp. DS2015]